MGKRISRHASERIRKRGASFGFVNKVVRGEVRRSRMPANRPDRIILTARDDLSGRYWSVVCNIECTKAITVHKAKKKEIRNYEKSV
jgi:uncharacterized DUF497 family protein